MRTFPLLAAGLMLSLLAGCANEYDGYFDSKGDFVPLNKPNPAQRAPKPVTVATPASPALGWVAHQGYDVAGYYDGNGGYMPIGGDVSIPREMFPQQGSCRIWYLDRAAADQPDIQPCSSLINSRLPAGTYLVHG